MSYRPIGQPLSELDRVRVRDLITRLGERQVAQAFGVDAKTILRCAAGVGVYRGTAALIRSRLPEIEAEAA